MWINSQILRFPCDTFGIANTLASRDWIFDHLMLSTKKVMTKRGKLWNKIYILRQDKKNSNERKMSLFFGLLCPPPGHRVSASCIRQTSAIGSNTCSAVESSVLPASAIRLLKRWHSFFILQGDAVMLRSGSCKLSMIQHLMHSPLSQKT